MSRVRPAAEQASKSLNWAQIKVNSKPIKFTEVKDKRLLKVTPMEREKLIFVDNSYDIYVGGVGESLQRNCSVRLRYYWAGLKAFPSRINNPSSIMR